MYAQVVEYGPPTVLQLSSEQVAALRMANNHWRKSLRLARSPFEIDVGPEGTLIRARDVAGFVRAGDVSLDVIPKFLSPDEVGPSWRVSLWRLLAFAQGVDSLAVMTVGVETAEHGIADLLADLFIASVETSALLGLPLGYRSQRRLTEFMTGRLDSRRVARLVYPDGRLPTETRRLTRDTDQGRLLKWAALELSNMVDSSERRGRLRAWAAGLPEVGSIPPKSFQAWSVGRQFPHLTQAFQVAQMLLEDHWGDYGPGSMKLPGFLWKSESLFEKSMLRLIQRCARPLGFSADKRSHLLAVESGSPSPGGVATTPDITVYRAGKPVTVLDAKYKVLNGYPSNSDLYQVLSGGRVTNTARVALLYPAAAKGLYVRTLIPEGRGSPSAVDLVMVGLGSFASPQDLRNSADQMTSWLAASAVATAP